MRKLLLSLCLIAISAAAWAAPHFPALSGRVVDGAHILSQQTIWQLDQELAQYQAGTTNQVVVVTLASLDGYDIEQYGYQLGRYWQIGQKDKNNGALLIVVPSEHKVRIEVGYGLEPLLTDAATSVIIHDVMEPEFKAGRMSQGIVKGTQAMLDVLGGKSAAVSQMQNAGQPSTLQTILFILFLFFFFRFAMHHPFLAAMLMANSRFGTSGTGDYGGGFSGGGGSFGGGGSSGSW